MSAVRRCWGWLAVMLLLGVTASAVAREDDEEQAAWVEQDLVLPAAPKESAWLPFYVSAATENRFSVDAESLTVGSDGVVRYVLRIVTPEGARNVSYEGMRCETREFRLYASGRRDGSWSKARGSKWERIRDAGANRHHAALFLDYFCPGGVIVRSGREALDALRKGGAASLQRW